MDATVTDLPVTTVSTRMSFWNRSFNFSMYNENDSYYAYLDEAMLKYLEILWFYVAPTCFFLITIVGTIGNGLVVYIILSNKQMQTTTNLLLLNLAIADISFLLICVPFTTYKYASMGWPLGDVFCKVSRYFSYVTTYVTIWTLVSISVLRFMTVVYSNGTLAIRTKQNITILNGCIWAVMLLVNCPIVLYAQVNTVHGGYTYCGLQSGITKHLFISFFVLTYALPLTLMCILYLLIMIYLRRHQSAVLNKNHSHGRTMRACRMIVLVVVVFGLSWLPSHVQSLVSLRHHLPTGPVYITFRILWECMSFINSCANPMIYNYGSQDFRKCFKEIMCCQKFAYWKMRRQQSERSTARTTVDNAYFV